MPRPRAPAPSVESILHALLPPRFVLHSHADAVLALTDTPGGVALAEDTFGPDVLVVPYAMPGLALAKLAPSAGRRGRRPAVTGLVLARHGLFTFDDDARAAYERHLDLVGRALDRVEAALGRGPAGRARRRSGRPTAPTTAPSAPATGRRARSPAAPWAAWPRCAGTCRPPPAGPSSCAGGGARTPTASRPGPTWAASPRRDRPPPTTSCGPGGSRCWVGTWTATPPPTGATWPSTATGWATGR